MNFRRSKGLLALIASALIWVLPAQAQDAPDVIFVNGKVLTVDENFATVQDVAVTGNQISGVDTNEDIRALASATTRVIDLDGKTLFPGLIDNHNHLLFNSPTWPQGARLDRVRTRAQALIAHTQSNAYLMHKEELLGSLEVGKLADIVVLDQDYMTISVEEIRNLNSVLTMVNGRIVYESADFGGATAAR